MQNVGAGGRFGNNGATQKNGETLNMFDNAEINFDAPAALRKWPSVNNERVSASLGARPYMIIEGTLDECIRTVIIEASPSIVPTSEASTTASSSPSVQ